MADSNHEKLKALWELCEKFIKDNTIICAEATAEDRVYHNAPDFVHAICEIVGYHEYERDHDQPA